MLLLKDPQTSEKDKKKLLMEVAVQGSGGEKGKRLGKAIADKVFMTFTSIDPNVVIN